MKPLVIILALITNLTSVFSQDSTFQRYISKFPPASLTGSDSCSKPVYINPLTGKVLKGAEWEKLAEADHSIALEDVKRFIYPKKIKKTAKKYCDSLYYGCRIERNPYTYYFVRQWRYIPGVWGDLWSTILVIYDSSGTLLSRETLWKTSEFFDGEVWVSNLCINKNTNIIEVIQMRGNCPRVWEHKPSKCTVEYIRFTIESTGKIVREVMNQKKGKWTFDENAQKYKAITDANEEIYFNE